MKQFVFLLLLPTYVLALPTLEQRWLEEQKHPHQPYPFHSQIAAKQVHLLAVAGIMNEMACAPGVNYYGEIRKTLGEDFGITSSYLGPRSRHSVDTDAQEIYEKIVETYDTFRKPILLMGHSKGGVGVLMVILQHPELISEHIVDRVVLLQAALGGSPLAQRERNGPLFELVYPLVSNGMKSLRPDHIRPKLAHLQQQLLARLTPQDAQYVSDRIFYVRSHNTHPDTLSKGLRIVNFICQSDIGSEPNDGVVLTAAQKLDGFGTDLGELESDHVGLTVDGITTYLPAQARVAFARALMMAIYVDTNLP